MAWNSPSTWVAGAVVTAAQLNAQIRDNFKAIGDPWTTYTPSWFASGTAPGLGNGSISGAYAIAGKTVFWRFRLAFGSTTALGTGTYSFSLPSTPNSVSHESLGVGLALDISAVAYTSLAAHISGAATFDLIAPTARISNTVPYAWAAGDIVSVTGTYESA